MRDANKIPESGDQMLFTSASTVVEIREEDTKPCKPSDGYRKWLAEKWGRKSLPRNDKDTKAKL